jgi:hypothetical protein
MENEKNHNNRQMLGIPGILVSAVYTVGQSTDDAGYSHGLMESFTRWIVFIDPEK